MVPPKKKKADAGPVNKTRRNLHSARRHVRREEIMTDEAVDEEKVDAQTHDTLMVSLRLPRALYAPLKAFAESEKMLISEAVRGILRGDLDFDPDKWGPDEDEEEDEDEEDADEG